MEDDTLFDRLLNVFKPKKADADDDAAQAEPQASPGTPLPANKSEGELMLIKTDEPTAAVIMAIVSNQSSIPLNRLRFKSIKLLPEEK